MQTKTAKNGNHRAALASQRASLDAEESAAIAAAEAAAEKAQQALLGTEYSKAQQKLKDATENIVRVRHEFETKRRRINSELYTGSEALADRIDRLLKQLQARLNGMVTASAPSFEFGWDHRFEGQSPPVVAERKRVAAATKKRADMIRETSEQIRLVGEIRYASDPEAELERVLKLANSTEVLHA